MASVRSSTFGKPGSSILGGGCGFLGFVLGRAGVAPADLVALRSGARLALFALGGGFECAAAAHFLKDSFGVELGLEALEGAIHGFAFLDVHSTHASVAH